jgi:anti-sigma factor RsiW
VSRGPDQQRLTPDERGNLVAYIDGELDEAETRAIATKLAHSPTARREIESLEKTWELLEYLPRPAATEEFTARTLGEVEREQTEGTRLGSAFRETSRRLIRTAAWTVASLLALGLGYAFTQKIWPDPTERLTRDLPIAEHLDEYRDAKSFEFLQELVESPEFSADRD